MFTFTVSNSYTIYLVCLSNIRTEGPFLLHIFFYMVELQEAEKLIIVIIDIHYNNLYNLQRLAVKTLHSQTFPKLRDFNDDFTT